MLLLLLFSSLVFHPLHVSLTNIDYDKNKQTIEIAIKLFDDDFKAAIYKEYDINLYLDSDNEYVNTDSLINNYINNNFTLSLDNMLSSNMKFIKREKKLDAYWFYFVINVNNKTKSITIKNTLLNDLYDDQKNLVTYKSGNNEKGFIFDKDVTEYIIEL